MMSGLAPRSALAPTWAHAARSAGEEPKGIYLTNWFAYYYPPFGLRIGVADSSPNLSRPSFQVDAPRARRLVRMDVASAWWPEFRLRRLTLASRGRQGRGIQPGIFCPVGQGVSPGLRVAWYPPCRRWIMDASHRQRSGTRRSAGSILTRKSCRARFPSCRGRTSRDQSVLNPRTQTVEPAGAALLRHGPGTVRPGLLPTAGSPGLSLGFVFRR